jgi:methyl-accepting chemotaxis protein
MFGYVFSRALWRSGWLATFTGLAAFPTCFGALRIFAAGWSAIFVPVASETILSVIAAGAVALFAMNVVGTVLNRHLRRKNRQLRTAIDSMPQGMCMFDAAERLVVCNIQYYEMYNLNPDDVRTGATLSEVLIKRVSKGTFSRDPDQYRKEFLAAVREGKTIVHEVKSLNRLLLVTNHPMKGGGWIGTHEDITEARQAALERATMEQQEQRRVLVDGAISMFRNCAENLLRIVADSTGEMRSTATSLFDAFSRATQRAACAVETSNGASANVERAAVAAEELSAAIGEIEQRLNQTANIVRLAVDEARVTNQDIATLAQSAQKIGDVTGFIRSIAENTNLLALNATIEAARAGETGRSFAVVASEVKSLAVQTAKATDDISKQIQEVQNSTGKAVDAIGRITNRMQEIDDYTSSIAESVREQSAATGEISKNVESAAGGAKLIVAVLDELSFTTSDTQQSAQVVLAASESVDDAATGLRKEVEHFLAKVAV